jgi:hypothetical protein
MSCFVDAGRVMSFYPQILSVLRDLGCIWRVRDLFHLRRNEGPVSECLQIPAVIN